MFIAATIPVEKAGQTSPAMEAALLVGEAKATDKPTAAKAENATGSYEKFMAAFSKTR